jgi:hypothetical protein
MSTLSSWPTRRGFLAATAAAGAVGALSPRPSEATEDGAVRPFQFHASDEALADLRRRIAATKWPERETARHPATSFALAST